MVLKIELLNTGVHARDGFSNSDPVIESFLKTRAYKEHKQNISDTYVIVDDSKSSEILGYFTLSNHSILLESLPEDQVKKLPNYPYVGTVLLGRIGRDCYYTPKGFGGILLKEAMKKSLDRGSFFAMELHAKNIDLVKYYEQYGFMKLNDNNFHMIIPYWNLKKAATIEG